ncbi:type VI secretion system contractile sheath small subunit [Raoultella planticola]|jgi:type VI secretion system protein ImpB|uniref:type VI secretion system contractile sheath small subunit n=1 Tax=Raoultella planticola TaxID=575 RepID=UPI000459CC60|nr:type VI secretion system contractile sheath small subunit [Raoultella planticola]KAJ93137.1 type VI secretion protein [Raoultella planticola]MCE9859257.1 type VI secretion system contractile sheath small subunit [Raoultella planticola]HAT1635557.1 type VI secretion system contractile sheath small subunit [Raoultella planticola]HAT1676103.1 type VI secretion system contractile sheath small subunit [Raoultella planticola]HDG9771992.1 type VI secretion system contractile sheath small subunit [
MGSTQHKLDKARPPRVQITYDVEIGDAKTAKELPLVVGVMGEFTSGTNPLRERKFITIDKDNFSDVMASMKPTAEFLVESALPDTEGKMNITIDFNGIEDFSPDNVVQKVEPLKKLLELREQLCDLRNRAASNEKLKEQLQELIQKNSSLQENTEE